MFSHFHSTQVGVKARGVTSDAARKTSINFFGATGSYKTIFFVTRTISSSCATSFGQVTSMGTPFSDKITCSVNVPVIMDSPGDI